jgi:DNA-binding CsgD family transcriptional regulator
MRLSIRMQDAEVANLALGDALTKLGTAVFLLDTSGQVIFANVATAAVIGDGLLLHGRQLVAQDTASRGALDIAIASTMRGEVSTETENPQAVLLRGFNGKRAKVAYVLPAGKEIGANFATPLSNVAALVLVLSPEGQTPPDSSLLRDLLGVTLSEARLAALVGTGMAPKEAAENLGISEQTARVVLKRVFQKAGVSRQGELVTLIARLTLDS